MDSQDSREQRLADALTATQNDTKVPIDLGERVQNFLHLLLGATVHFVNEIPDGGKIIMQKAVEIKDGDTPEILQKRVMEEAEWKILPLSVEKVCASL